ncbi:hypothetical protein BKA63DRAFT_153082 [Paraphoma chrysanthemicola]|nr:hypothetical protein BKA63DRAFT_153082 [Paraphoma chrysanthemicola]
MANKSCTALSFRTDFPGYIDLLRTTTGGNFTLVLQDCRLEICGALWGSGNPDISGIGMATGYLLETLLCIVLSCMHIWLYYRSPQRGHRGKEARYARLLSVAASTTFDVAVFFAFAIQIACCVTLGRANFGMGADGMGALTMKIAWLVSTMTMLPLVLLVVRPQMFAGRHGGSRLGDEGAGNAATTGSLDGTARLPCVCGEKLEQLDAKRQGHRFLLFVVCWVGSFYPFFSRMAGTFGASQIGDSPDSAISTADFSIIETACFGAVHGITQAQESAITAFGAASWLFISILVIYGIVLSALKSSNKLDKTWIERHGLMFTLAPPPTHAGDMGVWLGICMVVVFFIVAQLWAFFRLRRLQSEMTEAAGGRFPDGQWTFGQIIAVVGFLPVGAEVVFHWRSRRGDVH